MSIKESQNSSKKQFITGIVFAVLVSAFTAGLIYFLQVNNLK